MDKIDMMLFKYKRKKTLSEEFKKMRRFIVMPTIILLIMLLLIGFVFFFVFPREGVVWLILILYFLFLLIWAKMVEGKWGTNKWKEKKIKIYQECFKLDQGKLIEVIKEEGMNCQQVYNLLIKKHNRMPQKVDKQTFVITIFSLIIAFTGILASPLQNINMDNYGHYVECVIAILFFLIPMGYVVYKFIDAQNKQYDEKRDNYEYIIKLLEDALF